MSVESVIARIAELDQALVRRPPAAPATTTSFATTLGAVQSGLPAGVTGQAVPVGWSGGAGNAGQRLLQFAQAEVGQTEQPPGSNDSPRIAQYRTATAGSGIGPWCAYFVSWAAQQAGVPLGESGQGFGSVGALAGWAQRTGRWNAAGSGVPPQAGDLIVWGGEHIGIVESVGPDGSLTTIEGNSSNMVTRRTHGADGDGASGFVRLG
jgi:CHAP domain